jgi:hypothetical protein
MSFESACQFLQLTNLHIHLFNLHLSLIIYLTKLICLISAILGGFGGLKLITKNPLFASIYCLIFLEGIIFYNVVFNRAFRIPENVAGLKRSMCMMKIKSASESKWCSNVEILRKRKEIRQRILRSIPVLGFQAGNFNTIERESSLIFLDFVFQQIVSLLLAF